MSDSAAPRARIGTVELPAQVVRRTPQQQVQRQTTAAVAVPVNNPLFKILFAEDAEPEAKRAKIASFLTFAGTKAETRERMKSRAELEDYLEAERLRMQEELMRLTDTDAMSVMQTVLNDMNNDLITFEDQIKPLTDVLEAIYKLQANNKAIDAFREIQGDKRSEATRKADQEKTEHEFGEISTSIQTLNQDMAVLREDKAFFGFGDVKKSARQAIAVKMLELDNLTGKLDELQKQLEAVAPPNETELAEYADEKAKMRDFLDISGPQHSAKQREIVDSALRFVATSKARIGEVRNHFDSMSSQMDRLKDANGKMIQVRAVVGEAMDDARNNTMGLREPLTTPAGTETLITRISREEKLEAVDEHVKSLDDALRNNTLSLTDLERENISIRTARDQHSRVLDKTRTLHTQGIASVASQLNTVLTAVSMAALQRSTDAAGQTLNRMAESNTGILQKEVLTNAMGVQGMTDDVKNALDQLAIIGKTSRCRQHHLQSGSGRTSFGDRRSQDDHRNSQGRHPYGVCHARGNSTDNPRAGHQRSDATNLRR